MTSQLSLSEDFEENSEPNSEQALEAGHSRLSSYGWMGPIGQFLAGSEQEWLAAISANYQRLYRQRATATQQQAWLDTAEILRSQLQQLVQQRPASAAWTLVFEYELPRDGGRRPDLVLLAAGQILVFEFKQKPTPSVADLDQVTAYARDLAAYHSASSQHPITAILVPTRRTKPGGPQGQVYILRPQDIAPYLAALELRQSSIDPVAWPVAWVNADYAPLPTIVQAARCIFQHQPLPEIKRARSAGIPAVIQYLNTLVETAQQRGERHLVLITGVPGAGKTLVGLQFVYQPAAADPRPAVFLSGNGPLISVLQYALKSRVFVQAARNFYIEHEVRRQKAPREHIIVFDEAQRAWDAERMAEKYGLGSAAAGVVLRIAERSPRWCVVVGLIGEGQQIHAGEEEGIEQWNLGLEPLTADWQVHCASEQANYFTAVAAEHLHRNDLLNLTTSLRTHLAEDVQRWVMHLLLGQFELAARLMPRLRATGFDPYLTRDLNLAKAYCRSRYSDQPDKRYGLLASARARNLTAYGMPNDYRSTQRLKIGPWYIDPADSPLSCCALEGVVTEFGCQGLELDFPIVGWGDDLVWRDRAWASSVRQRQVRDPLRLRLNSYRVLLTRGRDGFVVFVPPEARMDSTYEGLQLAGLPLLT